MIGRLGGSVGWAADYSSGHDLAVHGFGPTLGSEQTAQSLEPASYSVSPSLSAPSLLALCLCLSQKLNKHKKENFKHQSDKSLSNSSRLKETKEKTNAQVGLDLTLCY